MSDDTPPYSDETDGGPIDDAAPGEPPESPPEEPPQEPPSEPPQGPPGTVAPPSGGGIGGARQISKKRVGAVAFGLLVILGGLAFVVIGGPSMPAIFGCGAGDAGADVAHYQFTSDDGDHRYDFQLTGLQNEATHITVQHNDEEVGTIESVGDTLVVTGVATGDTVAVNAVNECGPNEIEMYTP